MVRRWTVALALGFCLSAAAADLKDLAWFSGPWVLTKGDRTVEEMWMAPAGGSMIGAGRTIRAGKMTEFEFLRIEQRGEDLFYIAQPNGRPPTEFKAVKVSDNEVVFENLQHDFPQQITYTRKPDGSLTAKVQGPGKNGKPMSFSFEYQRAK
jgi:hypothetical protein